jgi:F0F1-type ATP synthase assembly protein I
VAACVNLSGSARLNQHRSHEDHNPLVVVILEADIVRRVMTGDQSSKRPPSSSDADVGWTVLGYLIAGIGVWGAIGWGADALFDIPRHYGLMTGLIIGMGSAVYLIVKRLGT